MALASLAFVTGPSDTPTILQSLTGPAATSVRVDGFTLGSPTWSAAPASVGGADGYRTVQFTVIVQGTYSAAATAMQNISKQLVVSRNWLMVQWSGINKAGFLRTYRTEQEAVTWENSGAGIWELPVTLKCDPWLYGTLQTIGPVTITNNPASGTNPAWYKLPTVLGDAPAPTKIVLSPSVDWTGMQPMLSVTSVDSSQNPTAPIVWQTSAFTAGTDTSAETANAAYSGGGYRAVSFATVTTLSGRLTGAAPSVPPMGIYKVLVRVVASSATTAYQLRFAQDLGGVFVRGFTKTFDPTSATGTWVDLGNFPFPYGWSSDRTDVDTSVAPSIALDVGRVSGTGTLNLDAFLLVPIETAWTLQTRTLKVAFGDPAPVASAQAILDGNNLRYLHANSSGVLIAKPTPVMQGDFPRVTPGAVNVLHMVQETDLGELTTSAGDSITATCAVTISYYPRYMYLRPDST